MPINNALTPEGLNALGAAFGFYPQLRRNRTVQDPRAALDMPVQVVRGRVATTLGTVPDILNMLRTPMPMEMYGDTDYGPQTQVPYGSQELLKTLPLPPQGPAQQAAANLGALAPMTPAEALQAARLARQAALAGKGLPIGLSTEAVGGMGFLRSGVAPQEEALRLAQQRAALPLSQGGLGLPANNTAADRAKAMGGKEAVHFSRRGGDYTTLDSGKFAIAPFDAVGTHVGTPQAAMERFQNTVGYKVNNPNYALDELTGSSYPVKVLGDKPLLNQNGMPWGEDDLNTFLRKTGGHNYSDINGGKLTYQDLNADLRKKLFDEQGYTSIPYFNEVEGKGSVSYIVPPENLRSQFAAFDPFRKSAAIAAAMGVAAPNLLASESNDDINKMRKLKANSK